MPYKDIAVSLREGDGFTLLFAVNFSRDVDYFNVQIGEELCGTAYEYDAKANKIIRISKAQMLIADFARRQERIFFICKEDTNEFAPTPLEHTLDLDGEYTFTLSELNALPIKNVQVTWNDVPLCICNVIEADNSLRHHLQLPSRTGSMLQP